MLQIRRLATAIALFLGLIIPATASAQMGGGLGLAEPYSTADATDMSEFLSFSDEQTATVMDMHQAYFQSFNEDRETLSEALQAAVQEAQQTGDITIYSEIGKMVQAFEKSQNKNLDRLMGDIELLLTPEQFEQWPRYKTRSFRQRTLPIINSGGLTVAGATTDLVAIYEDKVADDIEDEEAKANLQGILDQYGREMQTTLDAFMEVRRDTTERSLAIGTDWMNNMGALEEIINDYVGAAVKIRNVNDRYRGRIASALPSDAKQTWETEYNQLASPVVYTPNYIHESFDVATELTDLTGEQQTQIADLRARYDASVRPINKAWDAALRDSQENISFQAMMQGQLQNEDANKAKKDRDELDASTYEKLAEILTDEQAENLPEKPASNWRDRFQFNNGN